MATSLGKSPHVRRAIRREETILRLGGDGGGYATTWTKDDRQLVTVFDGAGWPENPSDRYFCTRAFTLAGSPRDAVFTDIPGYPDLSLFEFLTGSASPYYGTSALSIDGNIYQFLSTWNHQFLFDDKATWVDLYFNGVKLIYSPDNGRTWCNQDGSMPVRREPSRMHSHETLVFFNESQGAFSLVSFLQMGKDYRANRDGYVYIYSPNGVSDGTMNQLVMCRVSKARILDRRAYEFFAGMRADGDVSWTTDIDGRGIVHVFPPGWGMNPLIPIAWLPSVVYNEPLGLYMMAGSAAARDRPGHSVGLEPARGASYLGLWVAANPWGPWRQILEETAWMPASDSAARVDSPQIAPKWIAQDGLSFWLTWWDAQSTRGFQSSLDEARIRAVEEHDRDEYRRLRSLWRQFHPYFACNTQRVDLVVE